MREKKFQECVRVRGREKRERERERETRQGRQGTYTEVTATLSPFPPLLYEHREDTHTRTHKHTYVHTATNTQKCCHTWSTHTEPGRERERSKGDRDGLIHNEREKGYRGVHVKTKECQVEVQPKKRWGATAERRKRRRDRERESD